MVELSRVARRAALGVVLLAIGQLIYSGIDPDGIFSVPAQAVQIVLAVVLLAGIVPRSYLANVIRRFGERASVVPRWPVALFAVGGPLLILALQATFAFGEFAALSLNDDPRTRIRMWFSIAMALIQLPILTLNLLDLFQSSRRGSGA